MEWKDLPRSHSDICLHAHYPMRMQQAVRLADESHDSGPRSLCHAHDCLARTSLVYRSALIRHKLLGMVWHIAVVKSFAQTTKRLFRLEK